MAEISREVRLVSRPGGVPTLDNFEIKSITLEALGLSAVQVRNTWMSVAETAITLKNLFKGAAIDQTSLEFLLN